MFHAGGGDTEKRVSLSSLSSSGGNTTNISKVTSKEISVKVYNVYCKERRSLEKGMSVLTGVVLDEASPELRLC